MTRHQALHEASLTLGGSNNDDALLEAEILLRHALGIDRVRLYLDLNKELSPKQQEAFRNILARRRQGEPLAYIIGKREFYGLDFFVDRRVLIPRPETELLVEKAIGLAQQYPVATIADIGTGSGAIAISLALSLPGRQILATDTSAAALEVARHNCRHHGVADRVRFLHGDLLRPLPEPVDLVTANLPYVRSDELPVPDWEPSRSRDGGKDGLDSIRELIKQIPGKLNSGGHLLLEIGHGQATAVRGLLEHLFPGSAIEIIADPGGIDRLAILSMAATAGH